MDDNFIDPKIIDLDKPRICTTSQSTYNLFCCLHCGQYYSYTSESSPAFLHAMSYDHQYFLNLTTGQAKSILSNKLITSPLLSHLKHYISFTYTKKYLQSIDSGDLSTLSTLLPSSSCSKQNVVKFATLDGSRYIPGVLPLTSSSSSSLFNQLVFLFNHLAPLRNHSLLLTHSNSNLLPTRFSEVCRDFWSPYLVHDYVNVDSLFRLFCQKSHISAAKFSKIRDVQSVTSIFLDLLKETNILSFRKSLNCLRGQYTKTRVADCTTESINFDCLTLNLPTLPLFKDVHKENQIPKISIFELLHNFDGSNVTVEDDTRITKIFTQLPPWLLLCFDRFKEGVLGIEKNLTIVDCPLTSLDLSSFVLSGSNHLYRAVVVVSHTLENFVSFVNIQNIWFCVDKSTVNQVSEDQVLASDCVLMLYKKTM
ncbi:hypothetical protein GEMRC1_004334 [Eukaryota sp. GEM-RC1]